ncbi:lipase family protein [Glutamicibacter arilaitensis]|uniref:lipase family protein n=1 Tax=Glutamicibacter arilaitensis TaxID=256701 RepID=UPI00384FC245
MRLLPRARRLLSTAGGLLLIMIGLALIANSATSVSLIILLLCSGLVLTGLLRLPDAWQASSWRAAHLTGAVLLVLAGITLLIWRSATLPMLALLVSLALLTGGLLRALPVVQGERKPSVRGVLTVLVGLFASVLVIFWPRLSLWVLGVTFGGWLVLLGLHSLFETFAHRLPKAPRWVSRMGQTGLTLAIAGCLVLLLATGAATAWLHSNNERAVPDEFYLPPSAVPDEPGRLIRSEVLEGEKLSGTQAWRILYTTTLADDTPAVSSAVVTVPLQNSDAEHPVISWANGTKGIIPRCGLSQSAAPYEDGPSGARDAILKSGWAVVATDYVGLGTKGPHPYLVGESEAYAVLDATRAASELPDVNLSKQTVLWGHSQGGHAALFGAENAVSYAPELEVLGAAGMAPATDLTRLATGIKNEASGKIVTSYIVSAWDEVYPDLDIAAQQNSSVRSAVDRISQLCFSGKDALSALATSSQLFDAVIGEEALDGPIGDLLRENSVPHSISVPVFVSQGTADSLVLPSMQRGWRDGVCEAGSDLLYREYDGLEHVGLVEVDSPLNHDLVQWTKALLTGQQEPGNCAR